MAKYLQRINKETHKYQFEFKFLSFSINLSSKTECSIKIIVEKNEKSFETNSDPPLINKKATFSESLTLDLTLYKDKKRKKYLDKFVEINVILLLQSEEKLAGSTKFNVADFMNNIPSQNISQIIRILENCPDPKAQLVFEVLPMKIEQKTSKNGTSNNRVSVEKESPSIKSIRSPSFGSNLSLTPQKFESYEDKNPMKTQETQENQENIEENKKKQENIEENKEINKEIRLSFGGNDNKKPNNPPILEEKSIENELKPVDPILEEKYMESQLNLQKNMEKYEEMIQMNMDLKKEKAEEGSTLRRVIDEKNKALSELAVLFEGTDSSIQAQLQTSQEKIKDLELEIRTLLEEHENKEVHLKAIIESQNGEISYLKEKLEAHTNKIRLFLLKQSSKFQLKPLPKPQDLNEILPNAFQTIDLQGLMQGIYKKTEEIFKQLNEKLASSNETIVKLREFITKHSQIIENLQGKVFNLEQENLNLRNDGDNEEKNEYLKEIFELKAIIKDLDEKILIKETRIQVLEANLIEKIENLNEMRKHAERMERELLDNKIKISEAMNAAFESGGPELVEFIEKVIIANNETS